MTDNFRFASALIALRDANQVLRTTGLRGLSASEKEAAVQLVQLIADMVLDQSEPLHRALNERDQSSATKTN